MLFEASYQLDWDSLIKFDAIFLMKKDEKLPRGESWAQGI